MGQILCKKWDVRVNNIEFPPYNLEVSKKQTSKYTKVWDVAK